ncbi:hypothetical protein CBS63078_6788 [Aspergillus niger]|uniref:Uncharacterized protein n=1 Tax=Aspergillus phoenicis ATCC 13157 TaxID=1353007 RepID=A0A370PFM8_ASPPH|nr:hypothetical protein CBS11350_5444 [Aspergillus niger]RDK40997.1 hypothetical protein M752DRAFT_277092 [Aspergillus phoenicis ATCC 13157]KAI2881996.1 hypothetical protein CBS11852_9724 [Aspergillus niger]KAI2896783.1 hypothetical protein CBS13152_3247 [Aspergillus niger]KAI2900963.1 hypothetical protein CBS63078_6788 [Aspergillus niger]
MSIKTIKDVSEARVDIVFVHGLETDRKSWRTEDDVFWPATVLPKLVNNARILAFESDDITVDTIWNTEDLMTDVSDELCDELVGVRNGDVAKRPIIFIAHCLGGLICEHALVRAANDDDKKQVADCTLGLMLLGTPYYSPANISEATKYFRLAQQDIPSPEDLQAMSQYVLEYGQEFDQFRQTAPLKLKIFFEGAPTKVNGEEFKVVESAVVALPDTQKQLVRIGYSHHGMSCFKDENDKEFKKIFNPLKSWLGSLPSPEEKGTVNNISNASFAGSTNSGLQLGQNAGALNGFSFGR